MSTSLLAALRNVEAERDALRAERDAARKECEYFQGKSTCLNVLAESLRKELDAARAELAALPEPVGDDVLRAALSDAILSNVLLEYGLENKDVSEIIADISPHLHVREQAAWRKGRDAAVREVGALSVDAADPIAAQALDDTIPKLRALEPERGA